MSCTPPQKNRIHVANKPIWNSESNVFNIHHIVFHSCFGSSPELFRPPSLGLGDTSWLPVLNARRYVHPEWSGLGLILVAWAHWAKPWGVCSHQTSSSWSFKQTSCLKRALAEKSSRNRDLLWWCIGPGACISSIHWRVYVDASMSDFFDGRWETGGEGSTRPTVGCWS